MFSSALALGAPPESLLTEITGTAGLDFRHETGATGSYHLPEIMGSGGAFLDFDNDDDLDVYLVQSGGDRGNRLYRQDSGGRLVDVTEQAGVGDPGYGMGVAVGDIDNDGWVDLFVTNVGPDRLYRNLGNGAFQDVTASAGVAGEGWSTSAVFCDYDTDGYLDLYVARYVRHGVPNSPGAASARSGKDCQQPDGRPEYCMPAVFPGSSDLLYHNEGDGTFREVGRAAGIGGIALPGLGVTCLDANADGRPDFYVANDGQVNQLWVNEGAGRFRDGAFFSGLALNSLGLAEAGMGIAVGDADGDLLPDLFVTNIKYESNTLYLNRGVLGFEEASAAAGLEAPSLPMTGFGTGFVDLDHDGDLDLAIVSGRVARGDSPGGSSVGAMDRARYGEPNQVHRNLGDGRFEEISGAAGAFSTERDNSRGLALGDVDNDGDVDLLVTNNGGVARLYRNDAPKEGHWLQVRPIDPAWGRDAIGARITVVTAAGPQARWCVPGSSYLSSHDPRVHFGLPGDGGVERIDVLWPDGAQETFPGGPGDRSLVLRRGGGRGRSD